MDDEDLALMPACSRVNFYDFLQVGQVFRAMLQAGR
jgi:hypothetical protein